MDNPTEIQTNKRNLFVCAMCDYFVALPLQDVAHFCHGIIYGENVTGLLLKPCNKPIPLNS